jgi:segregation and condensation protein A
VAEPAGPAGPPPVRPVELWDLVSAFGRLMSEAEALAPVPVIADDTPQAVYEGLIRERLAGGARVEFRALFTPPYHRARLVGLFLALLELIRRGELTLEQPETFGAIWITAPARQIIP